jgi:hypothetical protein
LEVRWTALKWVSRQSLLETDRVTHRLYSTYVQAALSRSGFRLYVTNKAASYQLVLPLVVKQQDVGSGKLHPSRRPSVFS